MKIKHLKFHRRINHRQFPYFPNRRFAVNDMFSDSPPILDNSLIRGTRFKHFDFKLAVAICLLMLAPFLLAVSHC
jgi:hypothetical protein